jgi:peptidoglycan/xylan/chitin deacetylase (PgdA/CDA1 family)
MRRVIARMLYYLGCLFRKDPKILSIYFHDVKPQVFEKMLQWAERRGYSFVSLKELETMIGESKRLNGKYLWISFDDGRKGNWELMPLFEKYKVPVTIFCAVQPIKEGGAFWWDYVLAKTGTLSEVEKFKDYPEDKFNRELNKVKDEVALDRAAVTEQQLKEMDKSPWVDIQSHTVTHPILTCLSDEHLDWELEESKKYFEETLGKEIFAFSYPNGSLSHREIDAVKKYYRCAVTTEEKYPQIGCDPYQIPRIVQNDEYWANLARIKGTWKVVELLKKILRRQ